VEERILLALVEAMDFVYEQHCPSAPGTGNVGPVKNRAYVLDAGGDRAQLEKICIGMMGNQAGKCGFSAARRTPEDHRWHPAAFDEHAEGLPVAQQLFLSDEPGEGAGANPFGKRRFLPHAGLRRRPLKEIHYRAEVVL
jgi:hypothetical protein